MANHLRRFTLLLFWLLSLTALISATPTSAQTDLTVTLSPPQIEEFPRVVAYLDVHDAQGEFVHGLHPGDIRILENDQQLTASELHDEHPGVQFVIAVTSSSAFGIRDGLGVTRYEYLLQGLNQWSYDREQTGLDDLSLVASAGPEVIHTGNPGEIISALNDYELDWRNALPDLEVFSRAIDIASDPTPRPGMERAVLFITPPHLGDMTIGLQSLAARANQEGVRLYVWLVAAADYFGLPGATQLQTPTIQTGGRFFAFSGTEAVPDLETYLEPLRHVYYLAYDSQATTSGTHQVAVEVSLDEARVTSPPQTFDLELQAPIPIFISPPSQILRSIPESSETRNGEAGLTLIPSEQTLEVQVDFPDGYLRPLVRSTLYVDGAIAVENNAPPFEKFTWDLSGYTQGGVHVVQVEIVDSLGLSGLSIEKTIRISVPGTSQGFLAAISRQRLLVAGVLVVLSGSILILVLILGGRIRPRLPGQVVPTQATAPGRARKSSPGAGKRGGQDLDPVTQPVDIQAEPSSRSRRRLPGWFNRLQWPQRSPLPKARAYLTPISEADESTPPVPLPITTAEVTLGRDHFQVTLALEDASVEAVHARLRQEDNAYRLVDEGTVAGTWVNYTPVSPEGTLLEHGDLVHFGRVGFRFTLREPGRTRKPVVTPQEPAS